VRLVVRLGMRPAGDQRVVEVEPLLLASMLCAPIFDSFGGYSLIRTNDAINGNTLKQLRTGIL